MTTTDDDRLGRSAAGAVQALTEQNRRDRDRARERELVELRFQGAHETERPEHPPAWPAAPPDHWPGATIPEIDAASLTADHLRSAMDHHGSLLVRGLLDDERARLLVEDIDRAFAAFDHVEAGTEPPPELAGWFESCAHVKANRPQKRERGAVLAVDSPPALFDLVETLEDVGISRVFTEYFGERPMLLARKTTLRRVPRTANTGGWHQDGSFMGRDIRSLNLWIALTHCGDTAPGIDVVGRRLTGLAPMGGEGAFAAWGVTPADAEAVAAGTVVRPVFERGDALVFDHLNLHRTAVDPGMVEDRHAIETWFLSPSTYAAMVGPVEDGYQPRDQLPILL